MSEPSKKPSEGQPVDPPVRRRGGSENLKPGLKPGQERGPDGKLRSKKPKVAAPGRVLREDELPTLAAMTRVTTKGPESDDTHQLVHYRTWMTNDVGAFMKAKLALEAQAAEAKPPGEQNCSPGQTWDGEGPCPCCGREPERPIEDEPTDYVIGVIDRLLAEGRGDVES